MKYFHTNLPYLSLRGLEGLFTDEKMIPEGDHPFSLADGHFSFSRLRAIPSSSSVPAWFAAVSCPD